jgi:hypothetical protein
MENQISYHAAILDERLQAQKDRIDLMKWKLIIVAAIGSAGLGFFKENGINNAFSIIIFIPFSCVYVDLLCRKLSLRALKINIFLAQYPYANGSNIDTEFFRYYQHLIKTPKAKLENDNQNPQETKSEKSIFVLKGPNSLESLALIISTMLLTVFVTVAGYLISIVGWIRILFLISGLLCIVASLLIDAYYRKNKNEILASTKE